MEFRYTVTNGNQLHQYQTFAQSIRPRLDAYIAFLRREFSLEELPRCILFADRPTATELLSDIPIPAFTNDYRIMFCPELDVWKEIYLSQFDGQPDPEICDYYQNCLGENHLLQIIGHELAHHLEQFSGDYSRDKWFEEGMVEYISRRYFLTGEEFRKEALIGQKLLNMKLSTQYGQIFGEYWANFAAVNEIVDLFGGNVHAVFDCYHRWLQTDLSTPLFTYFRGHFIAG